MQEIDEFRVDRKGIRINWQIVPRAFAHSLTSNLSRIFSSPTFFDVAFLRLVITRERSHVNAKRGESSLFKKVSKPRRIG